MQFRLFVVLALACVPALNSHAQEERPISLMEALKVAVERNLNIELQRITTKEAQLNFRLQADQPYEPLVSGTTSTSSAESRPTRVTQGTDSFTQETIQSNWTFTKAERFGFGWSITFNNQVQDSGAEDSFGELYSTSLTLGFQQELLRNFSMDPTVIRKDEYVAKNNLFASEKDLEIAIVNVVQTTENAYWDLVQAIEELSVAHQSLELASQLLEQNRVKIEVGTLAPIDLAKTESEVATREAEVVQAENKVLAAEDALRKVLNLPAGAWDEALRPTERPSLEEMDLSAATALEIAKQNRPELQKDDLAIQNAELELAYSKNQMKPQLTLSGGYTSTGVDIPQEGDPSSYSDAVSELAAYDFPQYQIQLQLNWNPLNKGAKINKAKAEIGIRRAEANRLQTEANVLEQVRAAIRNIRSQERAIAAQEKSVRFQEENLKAAQKKFQNGLNTNYEVAEAQQALSQARNSLIQSRIAYQKAIVSYRFAVGTLAKEHNIAVK